MGAVADATPAWARQPLTALELLEETFSPTCRLSRSSSEKRTVLGAASLSPVPGGVMLSSAARLLPLAGVRGEARSPGSGLSSPRPPPAPEASTDTKALPPCTWPGTSLPPPGRGEKMEPACWGPCPSCWACMAARAASWHSLVVQGWLRGDSGNI